MFIDFSKAQKRYLSLKLSNGMKIQLEEPTLRELECLERVSERGRVSDIVEAVTKIMNRNKGKRKFKKDEIYELMTFSEMKLLLEKYRDFISETEKN